MTDLDTGVQPIRSLHQLFADSHFIGLTPPVPAPRELLAVVPLVIACGVVLVNTGPIARQVYLLRLVLGVGAFVAGIAAYIVVWLAPLDGVDAVEFALGVVALGCFGICVWSWAAGWDYTSFCGAVLALPLAASQFMFAYRVSPVPSGLVALELRP